MVRILCVIAVAAISLGLVGCGSSEGDSTPADQKASGSKAGSAPSLPDKPQGNPTL